MMKRSNAFELPQQQSVGVILVVLIKHFQAIIKQALWPLVLLYFFGRGSGFFTTGIIAISAFAGTMAVFAAIVNYVYFYFWLEKGELRVKNGLFKKKDLSIPFEKIQRVEIEQNIIHRLLDVVTLKVETAGGEGEEIEIGALKRDVAEDLRSYLLSDRKAKSQSLEEKTVKDVPVFQLSFGQLAKAGLVQNHLKTAGIIFGFLVGGYFQFEEVIDLDKWFAQWLPAWYYSEDKISGILLVFPAAAILVVTLSLIRTILQYFNFTMWRKNDGFRLEYGLFSRRTYSALVKKIQYLRWADNPLMRMLKMYRLSIFQAGSVSQSQRQAIEAPVCYLEQLDMISNDTFPKWNEEAFEVYSASKSYVWFLFSRIGVIPMVAIVANGLIRESLMMWAGIALLWGIVSFIYIHFYVKTLHLYIGQNYIFIERGLFEKERLILQTNKLQGAALFQNPIESYRELSSLSFFSAAGIVAFPYLEKSTATKIVNYVLFHVESSDAPWM